MNVLAEIHIIPLGVGVSLGDYIAACEKVLKDAGLKPQLHAYGTNVEGDWDTVMGALKQCHSTLHEMGVPRISTSVKLGTRTDKADSLGDRVKRVQARLGP
ncbi:MAG: MTH1187 family thiamine-binding protein [Oceanipulchritudo sp.]|jgi:uncharacterized protein (TIGR00106 family)